MDYTMPGFPVLQHLPELAQTLAHWVGDAIQTSHPLSSPSPLALNLPQPQGLSQWVSSSHQVAKYWCFNIRHSSEYSGQISCKINWFDLLAVQGTLKSLLQHHYLKASILWFSAVFMVQFLYPYMTTGKTIALTLWIFVSKVVSLLFNMLSGYVIGLLAHWFSTCVEALNDPSIQHLFLYSTFEKLWNQQNCSRAEIHT